MALRTVNLNLLPILRALLKEESVVLAAQKVGLSQPAMSGALAQLRLLLNDPILVRVGRSMRMTPRAQKMRQKLDQICADIELLLEPDNFDPATAQHSFVVGAPDYLAFLLCRGLMARLHDEAPGIRLHFVDIPLDLPNAIAASKIDLAVCGDFGHWPELRAEYAFRDRVALAVADSHPLLARARVSSTDVAAFPSLDFGVTSTTSSRIGKVVVGLPGLDLPSQISASQFIDAVLLAVEPPTVARVPASLIGALGRLLPLRTIELYGEETGFDTKVFWSPVHDEAREHKWLRSLVHECLADYRAVDERVEPRDI